MKRTTPIALVTLGLCAGCGEFTVSHGISGTSDSISRRDGELTVKIGQEPLIVGSGTVAKTDREAAGFHGITASHGIHVAATPGESESVRVEADDNLLPLISTEVVAGILVNKATGSFKTKNPIKVTVSARDLDRLTANSSTSVDASDLAQDSLSVDVSSSGSVRAAGSAARLDFFASSSGTFDGAKLAAKTALGHASSSASVTISVSNELRAEVSSSARIVASGQAATIAVKGSSSGSFDGKKLKAKFVNVECSSSASAEVQATEELTGSASSSGRIRYHEGKPPTFNVKTSFGGQCVEG
jgi:hypothetical protein